MDSLAGSILNLLGITGSGIATSDITPRVTGPLANDRALADFDRAGTIQDPNLWSYYSQTMNRPTTFDEMMRLWNDMSTWDLVTAAMTELVEEASQPDPATDRTIWYECSDKALEDDLNGNLLVDVDAETVLPSQLWHVAGFGNNFDKIQYEPGIGVTGLAFAHPMDVRRYWMAENRRCVGFAWTRNQPNKETLYVQGNSKIERPTISAGTATPDPLWYPWDFLHMRRMFRMRINEHGEPVFDEAQGVYKKLRMAIDQMSVARAQLQPDRYVINIDVQEQPPLEQVRTVQRWRQSLRSKLSFGPGDGSPENLQNPTEFRSYYDAWGLDTILWMAKPKGFNHSIEKLAGTASLPDVYDIEMLLNIFYSVLGMPKSWVGIGEPGQNGPQSGRALLAQDMRFMRKVRALRKPVLLGYTWLAYFHALLKGKDITSIDIKAKMSYIGTLEDQLRMEVLEKQVDIMQKMGDMLDKFQLEKDAWIDLVLRKYMHMPDDVINALRVSLPPEVQAEGRRPRVTSKRALHEALSEIRAQLESEYGKNIATDLQKMLNGELKVSPKRYSLTELERFQRLPRIDTMAKKPLVESRTTVVSSFGQIENAVPTVTRGGVPVTEGTGEPAYRKYIPPA